MKSIGIVAEGITDYSVISNIVYGFFGDEEPIIKPIQPVFDEDQKASKGYTIQSAEQFGGWVNVFDYCKDQERLSKDMQGLDYLIIQIDTDTSDEIGYDVSKNDAQNQELSPDKLIEKVIEKINSLLIHSNFYQDKIIFAIAVHSTECWLLPLFTTLKSDVEAIKNCYDRLSKVIKTNVERHPKDDDNKMLLKLHSKSKESTDVLTKMPVFDKKRGIEKNKEVYNIVSKPLMTPKELYRIKDKNPSLKIFIENLERQILFEKKESSSKCH
jgi:hypothetical protein